MTSNPFYEAVDYMRLEILLKDEELSSVVKEIGDCVPLDKVAASYISAGPTPSFPDTLLDVFLLTDAFIYNYELNAQGDERWFTLPLTSISYIVENRFPQDEGFWSVVIVIRSRVGEPGLVLQDKITHKDKMREFADACRDKLSVIIVPGEIEARELEVQEHIRGELNGADRN